MERMDKMDKKAVKRIIDASVDVAMGLLKGSEPVTAQMINYIVDYFYDYEQEKARRARRIEIYRKVVVELKLPTEKMFPGEPQRDDKDGKDEKDGEDEKDGKDVGGGV